MVSRTVKTGYAFAETGIFSVEIVVRLYLIKFYTVNVGLEASLAGLAAAIALIWDSVADPIMGILSDRTNSRFGRRRPYIIAGALLMALFLVALFSPPVLQTQTGKFFYMLVNYLLLNTAMTIISVPHAALSGELASDTHERTRIFALRLLFANIGLLLGTLIPGFFLQMAAKQEVSLWHSYAYSAGILGILVVVSAVVCTIAVSKTDKRNFMMAKTHNAGLLGQLSTVAKNRIFLPLFIASVVAYLGVAINSTLALFYYQFRLKLTEGDVNIILGLFILIWSTGIVFWVTISKKLGKKIPAFAGITGLGIMTAIAYPLFPAGQLMWPLVAAVLGGFLVGAIVLFDSLVADVADYDFLKTGMNREGLYYGYWKMGMKIARAISIAASGWLLSAIGFVSGSQTQTQEVTEGLALLFGPVVGLFFILGGLLFLYTPVSAKNIARIQKLTAYRKKKLSVDTES